MTIDATYKDGAFVPESPFSLPEGARVQMILPGEEAEELRQEIDEAQEELTAPPQSFVKRIFFLLTDHHKRELSLSCFASTYRIETFRVASTGSRRIGWF